MPKKLAEIYPHATIQFSRCRRLNKSIPKVENVVNPPQIPKIQKARKISSLPRFPPHLLKTPIKKAPPKFAKIVAVKLWVLKKWAIAARRIEPTAPPRPTKRKYFIPINNSGPKKVNPRSVLRQRSQAHRLPQPRIPLPQHY